MTFFRRSPALTLRDRVRSLDIQRDLGGGKKLLLLYAKRSQLRWLRHLIRMSLVDTFLMFTMHVQPVGDPELP